MNQKRKVLFWEGSSKKAFKSFPVNVQKDMGVALLETTVSNDDTPQGTENVLIDLGFNDAEELSAKAALALKLNQLIDKQGLNQTEAAAITGLTQPKISQVRNYKLRNISLERMMQALVAMGQHVEVVVQPAEGSCAPGITVAG